MRCANALHKRAATADEKFGVQFVRADIPNYGTTDAITHPHSTSPRNWAAMTAGNVRLLLDAREIAVWRLSAALARR